MNVTNTVARKKNPAVNIILGLLAIYIFWGGTYVGIKLAMETIPPFFMAGLRFLVAGIIMYVWMHYKGVQKPSVKHWLRAGVLGILMPFIGNGGIVWAVQIIPSGVAALLVGTVSLWMVILNWLWFDKEQPNMMTLVGVAIGFVGVYILIGPGKIISGDPINPLGILILLVASLSWALGSLYSRRAKLPQSPFMTTAIEMIVGGAAFLIVSLFAGEWKEFNLKDITAVSIWSLGYLILFGSIIGFTVYAWLIKTTSPTLVSTYAFVNPVVAVFLGWLILAEPFNVRILIATLTIVLAVSIISCGHNQQQGH
ncbi:MAG: EamA family transporter [Negativicutes bacterium]